MVDDASDVTRFGDGLRAIRDPHFLASEKWREQQSRANRVGCNLDIQLFERRMVARMQRLGVPMFAHSMRRSEADQRALYVQGVSRVRSDGPHVAGYAVDIVHSTRAWDIPKVAWNIIGHVGKEVAASAGVDIEWGGDWDFWDPAHWQIRDWKARRAALARSGGAE